MKTTINQRGEYARGCAPNILCIISRHYLPATTVRAFSCTRGPPTPTLVRHAAPRRPDGLHLRRDASNCILTQGPSKTRRRNPHGSAINSLIGLLLSLDDSPCLRRQDSNAQSFILSKSDDICIFKHHKELKLFL